MGIDVECAVGRLGWVCGMWYVWYELGAWRCGMDGGGVNWRRECVCAGRG